MKRFLAVLFFMVMFPYVTTLAWTGRLEPEDGEERLRFFGEEDLLSGGTANSPVILVERGGKELPVSVEEFLTGVLAAQIPADYGPETLKAQAVLARTYVYGVLDGGASIPEEALDLDVWGRSQMEKAWGSEKFPENYGRLLKAVSETGGRILTWEGKPIEPLFCRAAAGKTRDGGEEFPYLKAVESPGDLEAEGFLTIVSWKPETFAERINGIPGAAAVEGKRVLEEIQIVERDESGYVKKLQIGKKTYRGEEVQYALGLPSPFYSFSGLDGKIRVTGKGVGHGYGFSQAGANALERESGLDFSALLSYYFQNVEITKISDGTV